MRSLKETTPLIDLVRRAPLIKTRREAEYVLALVVIINVSLTSLLLKDMLGDFYYSRALASSGYIPTFEVFGPPPPLSAPQQN